MTLKKKMAHAALWSLADNVASQGVSFIVFMFVARLIGPEQYGLANICFVFLALANIVLSGVADGIIGLEIRDTQRLSTLFWCVMGAGFGLTLLCIAAAGGVAEFMGEPRVRPLLQWFSIVFILVAASVIPTKLLIAEMQFKIIAFRTFFASVTSGIVGVVMACKGYGAYALSAQQIFLFLGMNFVAWRAAGWRPALAFDRASLRNSLAPGFKLVGADALAVAEEQIPRLLIGGILGATILGYFAFVMRLALAVNDILCHPPISVLYPSITKIKDDREEQENLISRFIGGVGFLIFPIIALGAYEAPKYIPLLFGEAWKPAIPVLQIVIAGNAGVPILLTIREVLRAHNRIGAYLRVKAPLALINLLIIIGLIAHGIVPVAFGIAVWSVLTLPIYLNLFRKVTGISLLGPVIGLWKSVISIMIMILSAMAYDSSFPHAANPWFGLLSSLTVAGSMYLLVSLFTQYDQFIQLLKFISGIGRKRQGNPSADPEARIIPQ